MVRFAESRSSVFGRTRIRAQPLAGNCDTSAAFGSQALVCARPEGLSFTHAVE